MRDFYPYIVLYDGDCGFCNRSVAFVLKYQKSPKIHFAAIQSDFTKELFEAKGWEQPDLNTFYFIENGKKFERSTAGLKVINYLKLPVSILKFLWIVPRFVRDWGYDQIAKRRQRISKGFCVMPSPEERKQFIR